MKKGSSPVQLEASFLSALGLPPNFTGIVLAIPMPEDIAVKIISSEELHAELSGAALKKAQEIGMRESE